MAQTALITETGGRRERKKVETRRALAAAALTLAAERGVDQITVEEIANSADVSLRTFFNYFPSKEAAVVAWDRDRLAELPSQLLSRPPDEAPLEAVWRVLVDAFDVYAEDADTWLLRMRVVRENPSLLAHHLATLYELEQRLVEAVASRTGFDVRADVYPKLVVSASVAAIRLAVSHWELSGRSASWLDVVDQSFSIMAGGYARPPRGQTRRRRT